jgi:hypothetical protein
MCKLQIFVSFSRVGTGSGPLRRISGSGGVNNSDVLFDTNWDSFCKAR